MEAARRWFKVAVRVGGAWLLMQGQVQPSSLALQCCRCTGICSQGRCLEFHDIYDHTMYAEGYATVAQHMQYPLMNDRRVLVILELFDRY